VEGIISVTDKQTNFDIETKKIEAVSIEQIPRKESCNEILCEQHGVAFIGLGLLEKGVLPGDPGARITGHTEKSDKQPLKSMIVSDEQRTCPDCNDEVACHTCAHKKAEWDKDIQRLNEKIKQLKGSEESIVPKDQILAWAITDVKPDITAKQAWAYHKAGSEYYDTL